MDAKWRAPSRRRTTTPPLADTPPSFSSSSLKDTTRELSGVSLGWKTGYRPLETTGASPFSPFSLSFFPRCLCQADRWISLRPLRPIVEGGPSGLSCPTLSVARDVSTHQSTRADLLSLDRAPPTQCTTSRRRTSRSLFPSSRSEPSLARSPRTRSEVSLRGR